MKRLDVSDPQVFNKWRELYYDLSHEENIQFGADLEARYPDQKSFNAEAFLSFFSGLQWPARVVEIGGWKGELAALIAEKFPRKITSWLNIDMCKAAVEKTVSIPNSVHYTAVFPERFDWFDSERCGIFDVCVSAHCIEHLTGKHLLQLLDWIRGIPSIPVVVFEAPISLEGQSWRDYDGTHILEMGWNRITAEMASRGYRATEINEWMRRFDL